MRSLKLSVIIVNWNHAEYLKLCLDALMDQTFTDFDIYIVDNGSTDGSKERIEKDYPEVNYWLFPDNRGFSGAFNWGVKHTQGEFVLSLNPDVFVKRDFLQEMLKVMYRDENIGIVSAKLLREENPTILDSTGLFINRLRRPYDRGQGETERGQYDASLDVFGACGAAALYRRSMLLDIAVNGEYFDEDFFAYYEDADLAWRAQLRGWNARYAPKAIATHVRGWGDTLRKGKVAKKENIGPRLALRNRFLMTLKNDKFSYFLLDFPLIFIVELSRLFYMALYAPEALLGLRDIIVGFRSALVKRKIIQERRVINDNSIRTWFKPQKVHT